MLKQLKQYKNRNDLLVVVVGCVLFFFALHHVITHNSRTVETVASYTLYPIFITYSSLDASVSYVKNRWNAYYDKKDVVEVLKKERDDLYERVLVLEAERAYYKNIEPLITFAQRYDFSHKQLCQVIMRIIDDSQHSVFIDKGTHHNIAVDMAVVYKGTIIGKVIEAYPLYSKVMAITDKRSKVSAYCLKTGTRGLFEGENTVESAQLTHVDRLALLEDDDYVVSSGEGAVFPEGFCLGKIKSFRPDGVHFVVQVIPELSLHDLRYCYVIEKGDLIF